jgi:hypothetical protein
MNILNESGMRRIDIDLIKFFFTAKASSLEQLEEYKSGMFSTQQRLLELQRELLDFVLSYKNKNSIFFLFMGEETEQQLKIVVSNLVDEPNEMTKRFAIILSDDLANFEVKQLSLSSKVLTLISVR